MMLNFYKKGIIEVNNRWIFFSIKKAKDCLFSRRNGYTGVLFFRYSIYFKLR